MTLPPEVVAEVLALYRRMDEELAGIQRGCRACGSCCDFGTHGEILYASRLEREVLALAGPPPAPAVPRHPEDLICPYRVEGKCTARQYRPIGCRTYFCDGEGRARGMELYETYRAVVADISRRAGLEWDYRRVIRALREG
ncbi:MAG TPA: hypothetical protein PK280_12750 [Planctomycetota bacterium]|nr:hypothetical protein [Planctomycetota bacterium]